MSLFAKAYHCKACRYDHRHLGGAIPKKCPNCGKDELRESNLMLWIVLVCLGLGGLGILAYGAAFGFM